MTTGKQIAITIFTVLVFILFSEIVKANFSISDFFKGTPKPTVREYLLPSYEKLHAACFNFNSQTKMYSSAIIMGDPDSITDANKYAKEIETSIQTILSLNTLSDIKRNELKELLQYYIDFTTTANEVYLGMTKPDFELNDNINSIAKELSVKQYDLKEKLASLSFYFYNELENDIANVNSSGNKPVSLKNEL